ncbi:MAG TPA: hypothetical protein VK419_12920 [Bryobacteraceae bacterium]|nr:hypothetical protein [Bryobacteraceae bacterium]
MGAVGGLAFANDTLFVTDANRLGMTPINNRVLMFSNTSQAWPQPKSSIPVNSGRCPVCVGQASLVLGQPDFVSSGAARTQNGMNLPLGVASDGNIVVVADTANNRVLIWNTIPSTNGQPADIVLGQPDFVTLQEPPPVNSSSFRSPEGVWIQNGKLFVADTQNNRVLIWNTIPTKNNQGADLVLGASNFTTVPNQNQVTTNEIASSTSMLTPTSVTSDGTHLFVSDLGYSRVLIWNTIPTKIGQPADVEIGQKDFVTAVPDDATEICSSNGVDSNGNPTYPGMCATTMNFPRFVLSDGTRLFVADAGNDRVLVYNTIPTQNGTAADLIIGEPDQYTDLVTSTGSTFAPDLAISASNVTPTPTSLAWDGTNLYVADPTDYRVLVFTPMAASVAQNGVVNAASRAVYALGVLVLGGTITAGNTITLEIDSTSYTYTILSTDTFDTILTAMANLINSANNGRGDPNVLAQPQLGFETLQLVARQSGPAGNNVTMVATVSTNATITATAQATLTGGGSAGTLAPGTVVSIEGTNLADTTASADPTATSLPFELGNVQVYVDGIRTPIQYVSPTQINVQIPFEVVDTNSSSLFARVQHADGSVTVIDAIGLPITDANPGIFANPGPEPRVAQAYHASSYALGIVSVDGSISPGDTATVGIQDRLYNYTVQNTDTLADIRDALIALIDANPEENVVATPAAAYTRIVLTAKVPGPQGSLITYNGSSTGEAAGSTGSVTITALNSNLCCANRAGAPVTQENPLQAGEAFYVFATGSGLIGPQPAKDALIDGSIYQGPPLNDPVSSVSSLCGGDTATVISGGMQVGAIGIYQVYLQLDSSLASNPVTQCTISQDIYTSNIVTVPVTQPNPTLVQSSTGS